MPLLNLSEFVDRLLSYIPYDEATLIYALCLIDKLIVKNRFIANEKSIHMIFLGAFILSIKYNEDNHYFNTCYAKVAGIDSSLINKIEATFFKMCEYSLKIDHKTYRIYKSLIDKYI